MVADGKTQTDAKDQESSRVRQGETSICQFLYDCMLPVAITHLLLVSKPKILISVLKTLHI
jgi:hypothetical protein